MLAPWVADEVKTARLNDKRLNRPSAEVLVEATREPQPIDWIVHARRNRALLGENGENTGEEYVRECVLRQRVLFGKTIHVRRRKAKVACETRGRRQPRESREAEVGVRAVRVTLRPPWRPDRKLPPVTVNVVLASEVNPPPGDQPVQWLVLTSLPVDTAEQLRQIGSRGSNKFRRSTNRARGVETLLRPSSLGR
jgi:hypothetical protein